MAVSKMLSRFAASAWDPGPPTCSSATHQCSACCACGWTSHAGPVPQTTSAAWQPRKIQLGTLHLENDIRHALPAMRACCWSAKDGPAALLRALGRLASTAAPGGFASDSDALPGSGGGGASCSACSCSARSCSALRSRRLRPFGNFHTCAGKALFGLRMCITHRLEQVRSGRQIWG